MHGAISRKTIKRICLACHNYFFSWPIYLNSLTRMIANLFKKVTGFNTTKMVIVVRTDLPMGRGKIASQAAHAAILLFQSSIENSNPCLKTWLRCGQPKVVLKIDENCESALLDIYQKASKSNLNVCKVRDAGRTQVVEGTLTAVGIGPNTVEEIDKITSNLKLL